MLIKVLEMCDAFEILIINDDGTRKRFYFDQEDDKKSLVNMFEYLGFKAEYEEVY